MSDVNVVRLAAGSMPAPAIGDARLAIPYLADVGEGRALRLSETALENSVAGTPPLPGWAEGGLRIATLGR